jgi:hypothetical protein
MYSEIVNVTGISQSTMETLVLSIIAILVLGVILVLYWPFIIAGSAALFCVVVLANHKVPDAPKPRPVDVIQTAPPVVDAVPKPVEQEPFDEAKAFMEDCLSQTDYTKKQCEKIWSGREDEDESTLKLLDVNNREYKKRRAEALKKPHAVIGHMTL